MKTRLNSTHGSRASRHKPPPARRTRSQRSKRRRASTPLTDEATVSAPRPSVNTASEPAQPTQTDLPRGDALQLYLTEIGQVKLLTPEEEIALARRIKRGDKKAREHMIKANLRLVVKIARDYEGMGVPLLDLISEGNIGLMKGVERFDPRKGAKLSTYAALWIKQQIRRALANQGKTIRLPVHVVDKVSHIRRAEMKLREVLDREPTDEELAHELDLDAGRVRRYRLASRAPVSLDAPLGDDDSNRISEVVADPNAAAPFARVVQETDTKLVREILESLPERERIILTLRFGLSDDTERTLEEIAKRFDLTRERIRQIQEQALRTIRAKMEKRDQPSVEEVPELAVAA
jgi:RNA polymerase primary sigma factor